MSHENLCNSWIKYTINCCSVTCYLNEHAQQMDNSIWAINNALEMICELALGGTAVGTGLNTLSRRCLIICKVKYMNDNLLIRIRPWDFTAGFSTSFRAVFMRQKPASGFRVLRGDFTDQGQPQVLEKNVYPGSHFTNQGIAFTTAFRR